MSNLVDDATDDNGLLHLDRPTELEKLLHQHQWAATVYRDNQNPMYRAGCAGLGIPIDVSDSERRFAKQMLRLKDYLSAVPEEKSSE